MTIHTVPMTIAATFLTLCFLIIVGQSWDTQKYNESPGFTIVSWWALFLWLCSADIGLWYLVSISQ